MFLMHIPALYLLYFLLGLEGGFVLAKRIFRTAEDYELEDPKSSLDRAKNYDDYISKCESDALHYGSTLVDLINSQKRTLDTPSRVFQDDVIENLGFSPWLFHVPHRSTTLTGKPIHDLQVQGGWVDDGNHHNSSYKILQNKWIYMFGDSTARQLWATYSVPSRGADFEKHAKQFARDNCRPQAPHRFKHVKGGKFYATEGWEGSCGLNEVTCDSKGFGQKGLFTFDWKHFPYEDYDQYLFDSADGPFRKGFMHYSHSGHVRPTVITIQYALHTCYHFYDEWLKEPQVKFAEKHRLDVWKLMESLRKAVDSIPSSSGGNYDQPTFVILVTSGVVNHGPTFANADACIHIMNRLTQEAAYAFGFAVLDRGEIERRFLAKSLYFAKNPLFPTDMHLVPPAPHITSTALLQMISCVMHYNVSRSEVTDTNSSLGFTFPREIPVGYKNWQEHFP
jgi:hypothetical protein